MNKKTATVRLRAVIVCVCLVSLQALSSCRLCARGQDNEAKLLARIEREKKPVNKAKLEVRLGRVHLDEAISAYEKQQIPQGKKLLASFLDDMDSAWNILGASGRNAAKKPQGFRELEMGLNEDARRLNDLRQQVFYLNRGPIEGTLSKVNALHAKVLLALFPGAAPPATARAGSKIPVSH